jgi:photosystem II stability/assembly factor-like uncharacterized protein
MKRSLTLVLSLLLCQYVTFAQQSPNSTIIQTRSSTWQLVGPQQTNWLASDNATQPQSAWQTSVETFDIAKIDNNILYAGTQSGALYKTTNKGINWVQIGQNFVTAAPTAITIHPNNSNHVFIGDNKRLYQSMDGGATFKNLLEINGLDANAIETKRANPDIVLVSGNALYRGNLKTGYWAKVINTKVYDVECHVSNPDIMYALKRNATTNACEFWKSIDGGQTFSVRSTGWVTGLVSEGGRLAVSSANANRLYAVLLTTSGVRVLRSDNAGETWAVTATGNTTALVMTNGQGFSTLSIATESNNANAVMIGTTHAYKSMNGGVSFTRIEPTNTSSLHPNIQEIRSMRGDTWVATDGGMTLSSDFFTSPTNSQVRSKGLSASSFWSFDQGWNEDVMIGGRANNGHVAWGEGYPTGQFLRLSAEAMPTGYLNPHNARMAYFSDLQGVMLPSTSNGAISNFKVAMRPNESNSSMENSAIEFDPTCYNTYYIGNGGSIYKTTNNGASFTKIFTSPDATAKIGCVKVSRANPSTMYANQNGATNKIWKSIDKGVTWTVIDNPSDGNINDFRLSVLQISPNDPNIICIAYRTGSNGHKVYKSFNAGDTWINLTSATLNNTTITDMIVQIGTENIYLAADNGQFFYGNNYGNWTVFNAGLPLNTQGGIIKPFYRDNKIRMASNQGIWEIDFPMPSAVVAQPMVDKCTTTCTRDTFYFDSYSVAPANATYQWAFPGSTYVSSTNIRAPKVVYGAPGTYSVTLTVNGNTKTIPQMITVKATDCSIDTLALKALDLTATNNYVSLPSIVGLSGVNSFTTSAWVKAATQQNNNAQIISNWSSDAAFALGFGNNNTLVLSWKGTKYPVAHALPVGEWSHIALTITPTTATVYLNGVPISINGNFSGFNVANTEFELGGNAPTQGSDFNGWLEEVKIYNYALSQNEIREKIHLIARSLENGLIAYYQFNEASGERVSDKIGAATGIIGGNVYQRVPSTAPIAVGSSARFFVNSGGLKVFSGTGLSLTFPNTGTLPNGELVAYYLNAVPNTPINNGTIEAASQGTSGIVMPIMPTDKGYWIVRNYGTNATFASVTNATFTKNRSITSNTNAATLGLFKRASNADRATWSAPLAAAANATTDNITFSAGLNLTSFSQFAIGSLEQNNSNITTSTNINNTGWNVINDGMITVEKGAKLELSVTNNPDCAYTWSNDNYLTATTNAILISNNISLAHAGKYIVSIRKNNAVIAVKIITLMVTAPCATDVTLPVLSACPANQALTTSGTTATATWVAPTATDNCGSPIVTTSHSIATSFPIGTTTVTYKATDSKGNFSTCSFTITVTKTPIVFNANACYTLTSRHSNLLMEVKDAAYASNTAVIQALPSSALSQIWRIVPTTNDEYRITNSATTRTLTISNTTTGAPVIQYRWLNDNTQKWAINLNNDGYATLTNKNSNKNIDINAASTLPNMPLIQQPINTTYAQQWKIETRTCPLDARSEEAEIQQSNLTIYPNPTTHTAFLSLKEGIAVNQLLGITIYNALGQRMQQINQLSTTEPIRLDVQHLPTGNYMIHVQLEKGKSITKPLMILAE